MPVTRQTPKRVVLDAIRRTAALEYALVEACHDDSSRADEVSQAMLASRAGTAQVHLFDLGTALRELGDDSFSYSRCVRAALMRPGNHTDVLHRLDREYAQLLGRPDLPDGLRVLLRANHLDHHPLRTRPEQRLAA